MSRKEISKIVRLAVTEDVGKKDLTASLISPHVLDEAYIVSKQKAVICGVALVNEVFKVIDPKVKVIWLIKDGEHVRRGQVLCRLRGAARSLLTGERAALNFLQTLSSTATLTSLYVAKLKDTKAQLLDTRKTLPGMRLLQKYAVRCGGGHNHRLGLYDAILIKENHISACGSITNAVLKAKKLYPKKSIELEVRNLNEFNEALRTAANIIMLDNFSSPMIRAAVATKHQGKKLELSGGVSLQTIRKLARTGVDYISVGAITKTVIQVDLSMLFTKV